MLKVFEFIDDTYNIIKCDLFLKSMDRDKKKREQNQKYVDLDEQIENSLNEIREKED